jgi:cytoplasmic iron level regulating protein YaaA (DUF328/UPF0246 family)
MAEGDVRDGAEGETPAVELFDGPLFSLAQDLRVREDWPEDVALYVVTSQFGTVPADQPLKPYRRTMTARLAADATDQQSARLRRAG